MSKTTMLRLTSRRARPVFLKAWLLCGSLDLLSAVVINCLLLKKVTVLQLLQYISSGAYGKAAFQGGWYTGIAGLVFHYLVAGFFTGAYCLYAMRYPARGKTLVLHGVGYGLLVWCVMNLVVLPLSRLHTWPQWPGAITGILVLMFLFALPMAAYTWRKLPMAGQQHNGI